MNLKDEMERWIGEVDDKWESNDKGDPIRPVEEISIVRKLPKSAYNGISDASGPMAILTPGRNPSNDRDVYQHDGSRGVQPGCSPTVKRFVAPLAGSIAAIIEITSVWPMEFVKTVRQIDPTRSVLAEIKAQGLGIYRGLPPMLIGAPIQGIVRFGTLDLINHLMRNEDTGRVGRFSGIISGCISGCIESCIVTVPVETMKVRLIKNGNNNKGICALIKDEGVAAVYKGLLPTVIRNSSNQSIRFTVFGEYKRWVVGDRPQHELRPWEALTGGMLSGIVSACLNTPADTVKTRMQSHNGKARILNTTKIIINQSGVSGLWAGLTYRLLRVVPGQGILFCSYDVISQHLHNTLK